MMTVREYVSARKKILQARIASLAVKPHLLIIQVNDDPGSNAYVRGKLKDAAELGLLTTHQKLPLSTTEDELLAIIAAANADPTIHGIVVQLPLPPKIHPERIALAVSPEKDIDGFHPLSRFIPCTAKGILAYLHALKIPLTGQNAVVIGRSIIVGRPVAKLLLAEDCNVTILHSKTKEEDLRRHLSTSDIIVAATGRRWLIDDQPLKKSAVVIDVGITRHEGHLAGDVRPGRDVLLQTPVPGGVGLLTRLSLLENLLEASENGIQHQ